MYFSTFPSRWNTQAIAYKFLRNIAENLIQYTKHDQTDPLLLEPHLHHRKREFGDLRIGQVEQYSCKLNSGLRHLFFQNQDWYKHTQQLTYTFFM